MRCKTCDYRLWNLPARRCPECGTPFAPSQFRFAPSSVQFCCPHCNQAYFGTGAHGHLVPAAFDCAKCGRAIHMDEMVLLPAEGLEEEQTEAGRNPWIERRDCGFSKGLFETIWMAMVRPKDLARMIRTAEDQGNEAWKFAILVNSLAMLVGVFPFFLLPMGLGMMFGGGPGVVGSIAILGVMAVVMLVASVVGTVISILIWGGITHLLLNREARRLRTTYQALCYSSGANAATAVPCLGMYVGWIWWLVSAVLMVKESHKVGGGRAALAVLTMPVVSIVVLGGLYTAFVLYAISMASAGGAFGGMSSFQAQAVVSGLNNYALRKGAYPSHAIELIFDVEIMPSNLQAMPYSTQLNRVPLAKTNLAAFDRFPKRQQQQVVKAAIAALPEGTISHRLADCVFTYHRIDAKTADPELWLVIMSPDPAQNPSPAPSTMITVGRADGTTASMPINNFAQALAEQNDLRAEHGLPPLPDPSKVTHAQPAVARADRSEDEEMTDD